MMNITINSKKGTIEITKKFEKLASRFGSDEYKALQEARRDNPKYKVVIKTTSAKKKESYKGLTYTYMETYIKAHDDEDKSIMSMYEDLRAISVEAQEALAESASYHEVKEWFLHQFPAIAKFHEKREAILSY